MDRNQKHALAAQVKDKFGRMTSAVLVDYQGLTVEAVTKLRNEFRKQGVEYRVVKNTLIKQAIAGQPWADAFGKTLTGMTGVAWSYEDPSAAAKVVKAFRKDNEKLKIKGGLVDGQIVPADRVETDLANMPGKDELRAQLLATLQAPLVQLVQLLAAPAQNFAYLLKAKEDQK
ncbi:MAG: 50S ribosomal protein L10 [Polyangiaceae bacterium]|jgi:large subunit ribosomal protein L10|nr:50S ribosomal protein L10 [Polyangiaceae bacterium]MBK8943415.1 50S ribosomal protein L10 [Polyangiaceae bacterium]